VTHMTKSSPSRFWKSLFRLKPLSALQEEDDSPAKMKRELGPWALLLSGVGCVIGTGIFVLTGTVAAQNAGPAVVLSFVLAGIASVLAALCYCEFASMTRVAGSAYSYSYVTLGELVAWIVGWDLILEYSFGAMTVAIGWSGYMVSLLKDFGVHLPPTLTTAHGVLVTLADGTQAPALFNLPAVFIVALATTLLVIGLKESAKFNNVIVFIKVFVILLFIFGAAHAIVPANWHPFIPENTGQPDHFGWTGIVAGAGILFFAYLGFEAVSTTAQEARNPQRDVPFGIIGSLLVCTVLYILVALVATGVMPYSLMDVPYPIAKVADYAGLGWMATLIKLGAIAGLSSVILWLLYGQSRIFWCMSRDGLLPKVISTLHPVWRTPWITSIIIGVMVSIFSAVFTVREAGSLCSIGTLLAFVIVCLSVPVLRWRNPEQPRLFKVPWVWVVGPLGAAASFALMLALPWKTWERLFIWLAIGLVIYFFYGRNKSALAAEKKSSSLK
jgi:basic amino acid/polyamine antiporter, APA family